MLIVDAREAWKPNATGKGRWAEGVLRELCSRNIPITFLSHNSPPSSWATILRPDHTVVLFPERGLRWHLRANTYLKKHPGSVFLATTSYLLPAFGTSVVRYVPVIHDLIAFQNEPHDKRAQWIERVSLGRAIKRSWKICAVSASTVADVKARFPLLASSVITSVFAGPTMSAVERSPDGKTIFCLATLCPRKNQKRLIEAFAALPDDVRSSSRLVLAGGRGWQDDDIVALAHDTPGVEWSGYLPSAAIESYFSTCALFAYPSLYEGFGLPVLDAFVSGIPVLTSKRGGLQEVADEAALCIDPLSVSAIRDGLLRLLTDAAFRAQLSSKGRTQAMKFSWQRTADLLLAHLAIDNIA